MNRAEAGTVVGTAVRLQVQRSRLKPGRAPARVYDPAPLLEVPALLVEPRGVRGLTAGGEVLDVHHADHPDTRNSRLANGISVLPTTHYRRMRQRYGDHLVDGAAGESVLLEADGPLAESDLEGELLLETADGGHLQLDSAQAAPPCVEFSRFVLGRDVGPVDDELLAALDDLGGGARGFYLRARGTGRVEVGARLLRA